MVIHKKRSSKNMKKINNQLEGFKTLALGSYTYSLFAIFVFLLGGGAVNLRSAPGGKHSSYVTDVRDQEHLHRVKYSITTVKEIQNNVNCEVYKRIV